MKCFICKSETDEHLVLGPQERRFLFFRWVDRDAVSLCRDHLIEWFRAEFLSASQKMVVFYPNLEQKNGNYQYYYARLGEICNGLDPNRPSSAKLSRLVKGWLGMAHGACDNCSAEARIAYFGQGAIRWDLRPGWATSFFDTPILHEVTERPRPLCLECGFANIEQSLRTPVRGFEEGVFLPYGDEDGVYLTGQV